MVFRFSPIPAIPPSHIKTHHIRGAWTTAAPTQCEYIFLGILKQGDRIGEETLSGYERLLALDGREEFTRTECDWARTKAISAPITRAGSRGRHLRELARPECERARTNATSKGSHSQNASGHAQTPTRRLHRHYHERTKTFASVFVLGHEQPIYSLD